MQIYRFFLDTNVWFSFFYGSKNPEKIIKEHISGKIKAVISKDVLDELVKNITLKIPQLEKDLLDFFEASPPEIVRSPDRIEENVKKYVHLGDRHIFQACLNSKCDFFVTGNIKHFNTDKLEKIFSIKIFTPSEAIQYLSSHHIL